MVRKKVEGNEEQRARAARKARRAGRSPSAEHVTTGASKQRSHLQDRSTMRHRDRLESIHQGKQQDIAPHPRPGHGAGGRGRRGSR